MKYRKKPVVIEAFHWTEVPNKAKVPEWLKKAILSGRVKLKKLNDDFFIEIKTLKGTRKASIGDYIVKGVSGEIYPCEPEIFEQTYEKVEEEEGRNVSEKM